MSDYEGLAECTKCKRNVNPAYLKAYGDYELCINCEKELTQ
jgi:hypothetical protein